MSDSSKGVLSNDRPICIAIMAIGGQGGGVVSNWLVDLAESNGWVAQSTSVPGVAQRTGATIYYIEIIKPGSVAPVLGLMPSPGNVDLIVAAEWMEAGRAIQRGLVSPERTTLIASTHRALAVIEKMPPADGIGDPSVVDVAASAAAKRFLKTDLAKLAEDNGSVISASIMGAIAGSGELPFTREQFEDAIKRGGIGVEPSLRAFAAAHDTLEAGGIVGDEEFDAGAINAPLAILAGGSAVARRDYEHQCTRAERDFPPQVQQMLRTGLNRVVDYQDAAYGGEYLDMLDRFRALDESWGDASFELTGEMAKYLAGAMAYQDVIRVADLKSRGARFERVRDEVNAASDDIVTVTEFLHPRPEELAGLMPLKLRKFAGGKLFAKIVSPIAGGKRLRTDSLTGFLQLYALSGMRRWRRSLVRHDQEMRHIGEWLDAVESAVKRDYQLAVEIIKCRRLVKGYSDTHERSLGKYARVLEGIRDNESRPDAARWASELRSSALKDADGKALDAMLASARVDA